MPYGYSDQLADPDQLQSRHRVLFVEDGSSPVPGMYNDGTGGVMRDWNIPFRGKPSFRIDPLGNDAGTIGDPGSTPHLGGVIFKQRINNSFTDSVGFEGWVRFSSTNNSINVLTSVSIYNRDGANYHAGRLWLATTDTSRSMVLKYLDSAGTYQTIATIGDQENAGQHFYMPRDNDANRFDRAGQWSYFKLAVDFATNEYLYAKFNAVTYDLRGIALRDTVSTGAKAMHFSIEFSQYTTTRRYINVAHLMATEETG